MTKPQVSYQAANAEMCRRSLFHFVKEFWEVIIPEEPIYNWHIEYLCDELQKAVLKVTRREKREKDIVINIPPGTSKSTIVTVMLPAWAWIIDPSIRSMTASYSASLSTDHAVKSRDIIKSAKFKAMFPGLDIKPDQDNKTHYKNIIGGERYATSVTGAAMGFHAHLIIVDDPMNPKTANSEAERHTANEFMNTTLPTRKVDKAVTLTILVMQRLHELDCTGYWLQKEGKEIQHICLPGELSNDVRPIELRERYINNMLDVKRLDKEILKDLRTALGSYGYSGQIMQTPTPAGGGILKKWLIPIRAKDIPADMIKFGSDWDLAYTEKESNSASAYVTAGVKDKKMYITDLNFEWLEFPDLIKYMKQRQFPHYIEAKASGKSAKQVLTNQGIPAVEVNVQGGDKTARAQMITSYLEAGMVYCDDRLLDKLYNDDRQGILKFPLAANDDLTDALVQSINRLLVTPMGFTF